jgi:hypothetical protein
MGMGGKTQYVMMMKMMMTTRERLKCGGDPRATQMRDLRPDDTKTGIVHTNFTVHKDANNS